MLQRIRILLLSVATLLATALFSVGQASPAQAAHGDTCAKPSVSGNLSFYTYRGGSGSLTASSTGFTTASCPTATMEWRYRVTYSPSNSDNSAIADSTGLNPAYTCAFLSCSRAGTGISFPTVSAATPGSFGGAYVVIESFAKPSWYATWPTDPTAVQLYKVESLGAFNTKAMAEVSFGGYCNAHLSKPGCP